MKKSDEASRDTTRVFIGLGSNLGKSAHILAEAWLRLGASSHVQTVQLSSPYDSAPVDMASDQWFVNAVGEVATSLSPHQLLNILMDVEKAMGRTRDTAAVGYQDRVVDLDLLYFGEQRVHTANLVLPHPHRLHRLFVLSPLAEIAPSFLDCVSGKTIRELEDILLTQIATGCLAAQSIQQGRW